MKQHFNLFDFNKTINYKIEILAGLTVAMTMIPESLSFAIVAGFPPLAGLYAAFITGLITAIFGGRPGMVSGGAGATVIVLIAGMGIGIYSPSFSSWGRYQPAPLRPAVQRLGRQKECPDR